MTPSKSSQETALSRAIVGALTKLGYEVIRVNSGRRPTPGGGWAHGARKGTPDRLVVHPYCWLEIKDKTEMSPVQRQWHAWAKRCGIPVATVRSITEAVRAVNALRRDHCVYFEPLVIDEPEGKKGKTK